MWKRWSVPQSAPRCHKGNNSMNGPGRFSISKNTGGYTFVDIMVCLTIVTLLAIIAVPITVERAKTVEADRPAEAKKSSITRKR